MTALAASPLDLRLPLLSELVDRQRILARYGLALIVIALPVMLLAATDPRTLESGVSIWAKPAKFLVSVGVFALTAAWFFGYIRPERRTALPMRLIVWLLVLGGTFELGYIGWQAAHGLESHFNVSTPFHSAMYGLMGLAAVVLTGTTLPMAWEIARRPAPGISRDFAAAVAIGLVLTFLLGAGVGGYMGGQPGHDVGAVGGEVPIFGWNRSGGDLRIAHFLGIHAEQAIPLLAALVAGFPERRRWLLIALGTVAYVAVTAATFLQAVRGQPLLPL
jgi:hypothetical protein